MKPMKYKNSDLGMWHHFAEIAEQMKFVAENQENSLINLCKFYSWDNKVFEEYCNQEKIERKKDFDSRKECYKCPYYKSDEQEETLYEFYQIDNGTMQDCYVIAASVDEAITKWKKIDPYHKIEGVKLMGVIHE